MLERKLRVLDRQERVAQNMVSKNIREIERLKSSIQDTSNRTADLAHYDFHKYQEKLGRYGVHQQKILPSSMKQTQNPNNIRLPPLDGSRLSSSQSSASSGASYNSYRQMDKLQRIKRRNSEPSGVGTESARISRETEGPVVAPAPTLNT